MNDSQRLLLIDVLDWLGEECNFERIKELKEYIESIYDI